MRFGFSRLIAAALCAVVISAPVAFAQAGPKPRPVASAPAGKAKVDHGTVYLIRGLADVFSLGMNTLSDELHAKGVRATVTSQSYDERITDQIVAAYKRDKNKALPIILIGHSLGANKTLIISQRLAKKGIPVRLVVLFDATHKIPVPTNVEEVLNLHKPSAFGVSVKGAAGYKGTIDNRDVSALKGIGHISIDKSRTLHAEVVAKVLQVLNEGSANPKKKNSGACPLSHSGGGGPPKAVEGGDHELRSSLWPSFSVLPPPPSAHLNSALAEFSTKDGQVG